MASVATTQLAPSESLIFTSLLLATRARALIDAKHHHVPPTTMAMSAAAKRKKRIIRQHERHQNKQPFYRWLAKRNAALPEISTQHGIYPKTLIPPPGKSDTHKAAYCLRLIRNIDAFDSMYPIRHPP